MTGEISPPREGEASLPDASDKARDSSGPEEISDADFAIGPQMSLFREFLMVSTLCAAQLMTQAGLALAIAPLHIIGSTFHVSNPGELSWFASSYSLTVGTFILAAGRLGDVFGHRLIFTLGFAWYGLWSLLAGFSAWSGPIFFDCCRALQGIGPAMLLPNAIAILGRTYQPGRRKDMVFSLFGATAPGGFVVGAVFASLLTERVWWPWAYWIMGIACFSLAVLGLLVIPGSPTSTADDGLSSVARLDVLGGTAGIAGLILVNFAWNQGPVVGWTVPYNYALLIVGFVVLGLFALIEFRAARPLLPPEIFTSELGWVLGCIAAGWSSFGILVYYYFQFNQVIKGDTPLLASAKWTAVSVSGAIAAVITGYLIAHVRPSVMLLAAMAAFATGQALLATLPVNQTYWAQAFVITIVTPWGMDISFPSGTLILSNAMSREHQGVAASVVNTVVNYSISIGLGLAGTVESYVNHHGEDVLRGYRGASYMGVGLAGLGLIIASLYVIRDYTR
ncbi:Major facilitator superfamily transporter [Pleurostoma richardsiae]|uniref:Major facilitator superfamily transporter n=1 Tax=Pleurostoma richardsiae TaxID=41990 RepID=A0AA38R4X7_9PEZI|nr:Major facilitator superfamily transporter [Pleurostoma richardsiae]